MNDISIKRIKNILCLAEQGVQTIPYDKVEVMADGPNGIRQVTLSIGFTQYGGNLGKVLVEYNRRGGQLGAELSGYKMNNSGLPSNAQFKALLKKAGNDPVMQATQEDLYTSLYIGPAIRWGEAEGFVEPLSYLVMCDSFLHSGSILGFLRQRFAEKTPKAGGLEKVWIRDYVNARHAWLAGHASQLLQNTVYRTNYLKALIAKEDWGMDSANTVAMNGIMPTHYVG